MTPDTYEIRDAKRGWTFTVSRRRETVSASIPKPPMKFTALAYPVTDDCGRKYHWFTVNAWNWSKPPFRVPCEAVVCDGVLVGVGKRLADALIGARDFAEVGERIL